MGQPTDATDIVDLSRYPIADPDSAESAACGANMALLISAEANRWRRTRSFLNACAMGVSGTTVSQTARRLDIFPLQGR